MAIFITQGKFTRNYLQGGLAKPEDRQAAISRLCEQAGGKLINLYFTLGQHDFIVISEMPDAQAASVLAFVASGGGGIENSVTTQAFTTAEAKPLFERAGKSQRDIPRRSTHQRPARWRFSSGISHPGIQADSLPYPVNSRRR